MCMPSLAAVENIRLYLILTLHLTSVKTYLARQRLVSKLTLMECERLQLSTLLKVQIASAFHR